MSTRTPNLNLEKPGSDENYSISVFNSNADTIDTEVALRVKTADIINNLTSTATNKPLSAAQGKALSDTKANKTEVVPNTIPRISAVDAKSSYPSGERKFHQGYYDGNSTGTKPFPDGFIDTHIWRNNNASNDYISQIGYEDGYPTKMAMRALNGTEWSEWRELAPYEHGTCTVHFYDYNTKKFEAPDQLYWKIGNFVVLRIYIASFPPTQFDTMLQIRHCPFDICMGGTLYAAGTSSVLADRTIQDSGVGVYVRPNFTGTIGSGVFSAVLFGYA